MSILAQQRIREAKEKKLTRLDIGNCGLTEIPEEVFELTWLEELIWGNALNEFSFEKNEYEKKESENRGESNNLKFLSQNIKLLKNLKKLNISGGQLNDLSPLKDLDKLRLLWIDNTDIYDLSPLKSLINLEQLSVHQTQICDLTPLKDLINLKLLFLDNTLVENLEPLHNLINLTKLTIYNTHVNDLTPLKNLINLQQIDMEFLKITDLTPLKNLINLQELDISNTQIGDLIPLKDLINLQEFSIWNTQVIDLTPLKNLKNLRRLDMPETNVKDLSPLKDLINLQEIDISNTLVNDLSPLKSIFESNPNFRLHSDDCPLTNPLQYIVDKGNEAILKYWSEHTTSSAKQKNNEAILRFKAEQNRVGIKRVNEARMLILGEGYSGKTTLKVKLIDCHSPIPEPNDTTLGIDIEPLMCKNTEGEDFMLQVWDFGGQNIQKYAHQFFMSDSVVYAVLSNTREQNPNFQYWLNIIELLGKDSPFFIVQNEKDGHKEPLKDITQITERFPQTFRGVEQLNLKNAATDPLFEILKQRLFHAATQLPHTQKEYLTSFVNVRNQLERLSKTAQSIPFKHFKDLCKAEGIEDVELMNDYARTFTLLGIALHFADDVHLKTQVFLRPKWIIDALFALLYAPAVAESAAKQAGRFSTRDVENIWTDADYEGMHGILLQLMEKFYLCYAIPHSPDYIVPQRLPVRAEPFIPTPDATHILYRYKFLPSGLLTQLTCRLHTRIEGEKVWNDAVQFHAKDSDGRVFVRENNADNCIEIFGFGQQKADLINTVVDTMDDIHDNSNLKGLKERLEKLVPCPCSTCADKRAKQEDAYFFDYNFLIELRRDGETESDRCKFSKKRFLITKILKHASIRLFKIEAIKDLLTADKIEKALDILRGQFQDDDEVIVQLSRLTHSNRERLNGLMKENDYSVERNRIVKAVLGKLKEWAGTAD